MNIYLIGSLRNAAVPDIGNKLRAVGHEVFDDWHGAGPEADDYWQKYEKFRGRSYKEALAGRAAQNIFQFDKDNIDRCDVVVMAMPAGKSGHLEFGYARGSGLQCYILFEEEPERYDVMHNFAHAVFFNVDDLLRKVGSAKPKPVTSPPSPWKGEPRAILGRDRPRMPPLAEFEGQK